SGHGHEPWLSVNDRCRPMVRARGWHGGTNDDARARRRRLRLGRRVRPVPGGHCIVGESPEGSRQPGGQTRTPLGVSCLVALVTRPTPLSFPQLVSTPGRAILKVALFRMEELWTAEVAARTMCGMRLATERPRPDGSPRPGGEALSTPCCRSGPTRGG